MKNRGFTLIEIIIVIAVIAVLISIIVIPLSNFRQKQALQNSTNSIVSILNDARTKTLAGLNNVPYSVYLENEKIILYSGTTYDSDASTNESYFFENPVTASWNLNGGSNKISFNKLAGSTSDHGTITLSLPNGTTRIVTITSSGSIKRN